MKRISFVTLLQGCWWFYFCSFLLIFFFFFLQLQPHYRLDRRHIDPLNTNCYGVAFMFVFQMVLLFKDTSTTSEFPASTLKSINFLTFLVHPSKQRKQYNLHLLLVKNLPNYISIYTPCCRCFKFSLQFVAVDLILCVIVFWAIKPQTHFSAGLCLFFFTAYNLNVRLPVLTVLLFL